MTILAAILGQWKIIGAGLICAGLLIGGFWIKGRLVRAAEADRLERTLDAERMARIQADEARVELGLKLSEAEADILTNTRTITKEVVKYASDDRRCDMNKQVVDLLNKARGNEVQKPTDGSHAP